jgi:hypothetical protein
MNSDDKSKTINLRESFDGSGKLRPNNPSLEKVQGSVEGAGGLKPIHKNIPPQKTTPTKIEKKK